MCNYIMAGCCKRYAYIQDEKDTTHMVSVKTVMKHVYAK